MNNEEVFELLTKKYTLVLASTPDEIQAVKKIREDVFSKKLLLSPDILEEKNFLYGESDKQSFVYLLKENQTGRYIGTIRIFFINKNTLIPEITKEIYSHVENIEELTSNLPVCEVSRFALMSDFEKIEGISGLMMRKILSLGLMATIGITMFLYRCSHIFATMERSLHRILKREKINFSQIGEPVEYYGERIPYMVKYENLILETESLLGRITLHQLKAFCEDTTNLWQFVDQNPYLTREDIQINHICDIFKNNSSIDIPLLYESLN